MTVKRVLLSWSSGKDSAWTLYKLRQQPDVAMVGLLTTVTEAFDRVAMHAVRRQLLKLQADAADLPLWEVLIPYPCTNEQYEQRMGQVIQRAKSEGITHIAFGDLFLEDIRDYRIKTMAGTGIEPIFPIWGSPEDTPRLAREMIRDGLKAVITCIDPKQIPQRFAGRTYDQKLLDELPETVDPCGERGEFHTFCYAGPMFHAEIPVQIGEIVTRDGFVFADLLTTDQ